MQLRGFGSKWDMREKEDCQKGEALCTKREDICLKLYCSFICHIREIEQHSHFVFSILNTSCTLSHFCDLSLSGNPGIYATLLLQVYICWTPQQWAGLPMLIQDVWFLILIPNSFIFFSSLMPTCSTIIIQKYVTYIVKYYLNGWTPLSIFRNFQT